MNGRTFKERELFKKKKKKPKPFCSCSIWNFQGLFEQGNFITQFSSLNFHHSSLTTHHSSLNFSHSFGIITLFLSLNIFHTIYGSHTCYIVRALLFCYPRNIFIPSKFLFSHFPFPFSPVTLLKQKTKQIKISQSPLALSGPSLVNNTQLSDVHNSAISSVVTHFPAAPTSNNNNVIDFPILSWTISSDPIRCYFIP